MIIVIGLALVPLLFNNCGSSFVVNADGSVATSQFPADYESYGSIPSLKANSIPTVSSRFPVQAIRPGSGISPTITY